MKKNVQVIIAGIVVFLLATFIALLALGVFRTGTEDWYKVVATVVENDSFAEQIYVDYTVLDQQHTHILVSGYYQTSVSELEILVDPDNLENIVAAPGKAWIMWVGVAIFGGAGIYMIAKGISASAKGVETDIQVGKRYSRVSQVINSIPSDNVPYYDGSFNPNEAVSNFKIYREALVHMSIAMKDEDGHEVCKIGQIDNSRCVLEDLRYNTKKDYQMALISKVFNRKDVSEDMPFCCYANINGKPCWDLLIEEGVSVGIFKDKGLVLFKVRKNGTDIGLIKQASQTFSGDEIQITMNMASKINEEQLFEVEVIDKDYDLIFLTAVMLFMVGMFR